MKKYPKILHTKVDKLRLRESPDTSSDKNIIKKLDNGQELLLIDGPWLKVRVKNKDGWVHGNYVTGGTSTITASFKINVPNLAQDPMTLIVRKEIKDEYGGGRNGWKLQCTEYVTYRIKTKLGIEIDWPIKSGRNGGKWANIFKTYKKYSILSTPKPNCSMSFTRGISSNPKTNAIGHVAFVEEVYPNYSIKISEANWPRNGIYNERVLSKADWQTKYGAQFVEFV